MRVMKVEANMGKGDVPTGSTLSVMVMPEDGDRLDCCFYCRYFNLECRNPKSQEFGDITGFLDTCEWWEMRPWHLSKEGNVVLEMYEGE